MRKPDQDANGIARTEADHHMKMGREGLWYFLVLVVRDTRSNNPA